LKKRRPKRQYSRLERQTPKEGNRTSAIISEGLKKTKRILRGRKNVSNVALPNAIPNTNT
jgi:hypothetical protein